MKCEICHKNDATEAIFRGEGVAEEELYVCAACAKSARQDKQRKSQRTRKHQNEDAEEACDETKTGEQKHPLEMLADAFEDLANDLEKATKELEQREEKKEPNYVRYPIDGVEKQLILRGCYHLEGLYLVGEMAAIRRALHALGMELLGVNIQGVEDAGHAFDIFYDGPKEQARRVVDDILEAERKARRRLVTETPRVFGDSICRSLAVLKNCRLLSPAEYFDLLSPLRLAAHEKYLDGITSAAIEKLLQKLPLSYKEREAEAEDRDAADARRADEANRRFADVMLNERAEERFL